MPANPGRASIAIRWLALAATLLLLAGCTRVVNRTAERKIRDALPGYIGPARVWRAHVDNPSLRTIGGRLSRVTIDGEDVQLRNTVTCSELHLDLQDVAVDTRRQKLRSVGHTTFRAVITEPALNDYLRRFPPPPDEPVRYQSVRLRDGRFIAQGTRWLLGKAWPFTVTVEPRLASPTRLAFDPDRMSVVGLRVPLPASVLRFFARYLSDGFDFATLPFPVQIARLDVSNGCVTLEGTADVMPSLNAQISR